jgi:tyrosinase
MNGTQSDIVRRRININNYSGPQLRAFRAAIKKFMAVTDNRGYAQVAGFHGVPDWWCWHGTSRRRQPVAGRVHAFLPWHRAYLKVFEDLLLDHDANISLPWWDATSKLSHRDGIPKAYADETADGEPNPLYSFHIPDTLDIPEDEKFLGFSLDTFRVPEDPSRLPPNLREEETEESEISIEDLSDISDYGEFNVAVQQYHDRVHGWCQGHMNSQAFSAYDPIFWAHHCNVDRLWAIWQTIHGNNLPENLPELPLTPFGYRVKGVLKIFDLGYEYAAGASEAKF